MEKLSTPVRRSDFLDRAVLYRLDLTSAVMSFGVLPTTAASLMLLLPGDDIFPSVVAAAGVFLFFLEREIRFDWYAARRRSKVTKELLDNVASPAQLSAWMVLEEGFSEALSALEDAGLTPAELEVALGIAEDHPGTVAELAESARLLAA